MKLRAGVIGLGVMGGHHARILSQLSGVEFVGVHDIAENHPYETKGGVLYRNIEDLLRLNLDYCVVAAPTKFHHEIGILLASRGIHALIEKPVATDIVSSVALVKAFKDAGLIGGVGHIERYNPALQEMRRRIESGQLGEILQVTTRRQGPFPGRISDVGVIKDLATHDLDLTAWVCQQDFISVNSRTRHRSGREHEDMLLAIGTLSGGVITSHIVNWLSPFKERTTIVTGELGSLVADTLSADLTFFENGKIRSQWSEISTFRGVSEGDVIRYAFAKKEPLLAEHEAFRDAISTGDNSKIVTLEEGLRVVQIAEDLIRDGLANGLEV